jgi:polyisoprenyl-phosphate glycosyltransferase
VWPSKPLDYRHRIRCRLLSNQRVIALGLCIAADDASLDGVAVMDSDGEDRPADLVSLFDHWRSDEAAEKKVVVARRAARSEGFVFRFCYATYRMVFALLTGQPIRFGNFCVMPRSVVKRLVFMPDIWNNLAAALHRSKFAIEPVDTVRGTRYAGESTTNMTSLIVHGLTSVSVYSNVVFVRLLMGALLTTLLAGCGIAAALALKVFTDLTTPGWTTTAVGLMAVISLQFVVLCVAASFLLLSNRTQAVTVPAVRAAE